MISGFGGAGFAPSRLRSSKKLLQITSLMAAYAAQASLGKMKFRDPNDRLKFFSKNVGVYTRRALDLFNADVEVYGFDPARFAEKNYLIVSNHLSYIDIFVLSSTLPCVFVTSVDMGETKFLGGMAEMGGSIFVERRSRKHIGRDIGVMADTLRSGHNVVVYPEGTSGNGEGVLPFKKSLLLSAVDAGVDVLPMVVKYTEIDGEPFSAANRDRICWYGDMEFFPHFMGLMGLKNVKAELHFLDPISVTKESSRHELADQTYSAISACYGRPFERGDAEIIAT